MKWRRRPLGDVADLCLGKMLDQKKNKGEPLPYLANINVRWGQFDLDDLREMPFESHEVERYGLKYGDIVMCEGGEPGRCAIWTDNAPGMMIQKALHRIRPKAELNYRFLFYSFLLKGKTDGFSGLFTGSTIKHLPGQNLAKIEVDFPARPIQERIADLLSGYDDLIENNRRRIQLLEQSARLLYREWFVRLRFPGHEHVRVVDGVPEGWAPVPLSTICTDIRDAVKPEKVDPIAPYIGLEHIPRRSITLDDWGNAGDVQSQKFLFVDGDILFGKIRPYFHKVGFALNNGITSSDAIVIRALEPHLYMFVLLLVSSDQFVAVASKTVKEGSKMPRADWKFLKSHRVALPPKSLLLELNDICEPILSQLKTLALQNRKLREARDLLLPRLMNGEITV